MQKTIKNVLSLDIDYIMSPTIQLYNEMYEVVERSGKNPRRISYKAFWDEVEEITGISEFLAYDEDKLKEVTDLCLEVAEYLPKENIYFGREHDSILTFLCQDINKKDELFNIFNIDHHHDIYYNDNQKSMVHRFNYAICSDWVWYLKENNKLSCYYWIRNSNSKRYPFVGNNGCNADLNLPEFRTMGNIQSVSALKSKKFDYLFICRSDNYFPIKFQSIYSGLRSQIEAVKGTRFEVDNELYAGEEEKSRFPVGTCF